MAEGEAGAVAAATGEESGNNESEASRPAMDTGLACLVTLLKFLGKAADPEQLRHQNGKGGEPFTTQDILLACKQLEVKARAKTTDWKKLVKMPLPAVGRDSDGNYFIIGKIAAGEDGEDKVLVQFPGQQKPEILDQQAFDALWSGEVILMTTRANIAGAGRKFDVTWFIPALVKYRKLLYEILIASFFLQLFALVTPMFFQVVIDKVLVHKGLTTLNVMIIALVVVSTFEVVVGGLRTYVFSHTTNRVDVELGAKLFRHLLALPLSYFESRRVGESVARVRELDTIREFLTSSSVTLVIDLLFTFVFLAVMYLYSPTLLIIVLVSLPLYVIVSAIVTPLLRKRLEEKFQRGARNQAFLVESINDVITVSTADGTTHDVTITINGTNDAPEITSSLAVNVAENTTAVQTVTATDVDTNDVVSYSITGGDDQSLFSINSSTGVLTFNAAPDYENPGDSGANNIYEVEVTASDGNGGTDPETILVTVSNVNEAPEISSSLAVTIDENVTAVQTVTASDPENDTLSYSISGGEDSSLFSIDSQTGALSFLAAPDYENPGDSDTDNVYEVEVTASDGSLSDSETVSVTVQDVLGAPVVLDLGGDGVEMVSVFASPVRFDMDGDGDLDQTGWAGADDGLLVLDRNGDGVINDISEISYVNDLEGATTDMEGLRAFDSNGDMVFDAADEQFADFQVWQDKNQNGISEADELSSLAARGIESIGLELAATGDSMSGASDNVLVNTATLTWADGSTGAVGDAAFRYLEDVDPSVNQLVQALAAFKTYGAAELDLKEQQERPLTSVLAAGWENKVG
ncbi:ABC transporter transmembrane domain-containing protein [Emcibacter nanhaiensis]|uniref:Type I secretion system permease/ATPase n=1 Tax=Emcibacter nanhaiensis TaxID=1505037 RepID=A0A501PU29_9PROT|nr:ABC transporter transmembrane domain-containing protein [Emcibacter nanhaiensis]TPD63231.1 hypothetical protein FIV46_03915 [Emcibacter nanhaiensis]